ncbi:MAG: hypothetical protein LBT92_01615 [Rickettsiales bacterium]|nr:hypothetical protein [Rickettsiales bacterium]
MVLDSNPYSTIVGKSQYFSDRAVFGITAYFATAPASCAFRPLLTAVRRRAIFQDKYGKGLFSWPRFLDGYALQKRRIAARQVRAAYEGRRHRNDRFFEPLRRDKEWTDIVDRTNFPI